MLLRRDMAVWLFEYVVQQKQGASICMHHHVSQCLIHLPPLRVVALLHASPAPLLNRFQFHEHGLCSHSGPCQGLVSDGCMLWVSLAMQPLSQACCKPIQHVAIPQNRVTVAVALYCTVDVQSWLMMVTQDALFTT